MQGMKLVNSKDRIEDRVEVDVDSRVDVPEEYHEVLTSIQADADELERARKELGRLNQIVYNLINVCNNIEARVTSKRSDLAKELGLTQSRWVIDFDKKAFFRVYLSSHPRIISCD